MSPECIDDPLFGRLTWNAEYEWYEGSFEILPGKSVEVNFIPDTDQEFSEVFAAAHKQLQPLKSKFSEIYSRVREQYLELYNSQWEALFGRGKISAAEFDELVYLQDVSFKYASIVDLWFFDDDRLFPGHSILVQLDEGLNVARISLQG